MTSRSAMTPHYARLRERLAWNPEGEQGRFLRVFMNQNNRCNLKCRMCGFSDALIDTLPRFDMPRSLFDRIAGEVFPHASYVMLSLLTEPFMTRDFPDRLARVREHTVPFSDILTNGTILTENAAEKILEAAITRVTFSIDGGSKEVFEYMRPGAQFETVLRHFTMLRAMRDARGSALPRLRINHVLCESTVDTFDEFLALVESLGADMVDVRTVLHMSPRQEIRVSRDPAFFVKVKACGERLRAFCARTGIEDAGFLRDRPEPIDLFTESGMKVYCRRPWDTIAIHANGDVLPCMSWTRPPFGNVAVQSFEEIWTGERAEAVRREFEARQPGIDCVFCTIRSATSEVDDEFFYRALAKTTVTLPV